VDFFHLGKIFTDRSNIVTINDVDCYRWLLVIWIIRKTTGWPKKV